MGCFPGNANLQIGDSIPEGYWDIYVWEWYGEQGGTPTGYKKSRGFIVPGVALSLHPGLICYAPSGQGECQALSIDSDNHSSILPLLT
jgi:hypothetical protein